MSANEDVSAVACKEKVHRRKSSGGQIHPTEGKPQRSSWSETTSTGVTDSEVLENQQLVSDAVCSNDESEDCTDSETHTSSSTVGTSSTSERKPSHSDKSTGSDISPSTVFDPQTKPAITEAANESFEMTALARQARLNAMVDNEINRVEREHDAAIAAAAAAAAVPEVQDAVADDDDELNRFQMLYRDLQLSMRRYVRRTGAVYGTVITGVGIGALVYYVCRTYGGNGGSGVEEAVDHATSLNTSVVQELNETLANLTLPNN